MASPPNLEYWTWDSARTDYYHADIDRNTTGFKEVGKISSTTNSTRTPRALPPNRPSSPQAQPAEAVRNYTHTSAPPLVLDQATHGMTRLGLGQHHGLQVGQGIRTAAVADPRSAQPSYRMTTSPATPSQSPTCLPYYGQSPPASSSVANQVNLTAAGRRPSQYLQPQNPTPTRNNGAELVQAQHDSRASYSGEQRATGSSSVTRTPSAPHPLQISNGALQPAANGPTRSFGRDNLDPTLYKQIKYKTHKFFVVGKVFMMLYIENSGPNPEIFEGSHFTTVAHGEVAYHQFRRFVVVQEVSRQYFCYCCPITTYNSRATTKPGVDQNAHAIVYTGKTPPEKLEGEKDMTKDPIRIVPVSLDEKLDPLSRINLGKAQVVQHNWKIKEIGNVHEKSLPKLLRYRKAI